MCSLCKNNKSIIFYKELKQLVTNLIIFLYFSYFKVEHHEDRHYVCPYEECLSDIFVVFDTEQALNSHLVTKHKCLDAQNKIAQFMFEGKGSSGSNKKQLNKNTYKNQEKGEFNFTNYVNNTKTRVEQTSKEIRENQNKSNNNYNNSNYSNNNNYNNNNRNRNKRGGGNKNNNYDNNYNNNHESNKRNNNNNNNNNKLNEQISTTKNIDPQEVSSIFNIYCITMKQYICDKIKKDNLKEEEFVIPKETLYQLIMIIDKLNHLQMSELQSLINFGIDLEVFKELKRVIMEGLKGNEELENILNRLEIKKVLLVYKYFITCVKKLDGLYYKKGKS